jgi:hypothetical protein
MSAARVILITVAGPGGHVDVGVRSDATPEDLADALGGVIGVSRTTSVIEHRSPPRPGVPDGGRALVRPGTVLADAGVADGDLVLFRAAGGAGSFSWPEVQARPAEFGDGSPPSETPAFSPSPPAEPTLSSPPAEAPALSLPPPDVPAVSLPAVPEPAPSDVWPAAKPVASDIWPSAEPAADQGQASTEPDAAGPAPGMRLVGTPRSAVGRHARDRTRPAEPDPEPGPDPDTTEIWPAATIQPADTASTASTGATIEAAGPDQSWRHDSQEVNTDDWRG